jgi:hypothetical protein
VKTRTNALKHLQRFHNQDYRQPLSKVFGGKLKNWDQHQTKEHARPVPKRTIPEVKITKRPVRAQALPVDPVREATSEKPITPGKWFSEPAEWKSPEICLKSPPPTSTPTRIVVDTGLAGNARSPPNLATVMRNLFNSSSLPSTPKPKDETSTLLINAIEKLTEAAGQHTAVISRQTELLMVMQQQNKRIIELMGTEDKAGDKGTKRVRYNKFAKEDDDDILDL